MIRVCPIPRKWHAIHQALEKHWRMHGRPEDPPPKPLILSGWVFSSDFDKLERWKAIEVWAIRNGVEQVIEVKKDEDWHQVIEL